MGTGVVEVNKDCEYVKNKLSVILVPLMKGHLQCRDTFAQPHRYHCIWNSTLLNTIQTLI